MRKKKQQEAPKVTAVPCPLKGHKHDLALIPHPDRPDMVIARCNGRDVYMAPVTESTRPVDPEMAGFTYVIPSYQDEGD